MRCSICSSRTLQSCILQYSLRKTVLLTANDVCGNHFLVDATFVNYHTLIAKTMPLLKLYRKFPSHLFVVLFEYKLYMRRVRLL